MGNIDALELLTLEEVADICRTSLETVRYWVRMRELKSVKLGRHRVVKRSDLLRYIEMQALIS